MANLGGSGFTLGDRINPPPIGAIITYKYRGLTRNGLPKFTAINDCIQIKIVKKQEAAL